MIEQKTFKGMKGLSDNHYVVHDKLGNMISIRVEFHNKISEEIKEFVNEELEILTNNLADDLNKVFSC